MSILHRHKYLILLLVVLLLGLPAVLCACSTYEHSDYFTVMVPDGDGYTVVDNSVRNVKRGESVSFKIELDDGYEFMYASSGSYDGSVLKVESVDYSMTIDFNVRPYESIVKVTNGRAIITDKNGDAVRYGEAADFLIIPKDNYVVDEVYINGAEYDFTREANGTVVISEIYDEFISVRADCIGKECVITSDMPGSSLEATEEHGGYVALNVPTDGIMHYDDRINIECKPMEGYRLVYMEINNDRYYDTDVLTMTVKSDMNISALFIDSSYLALVYDYNGGECVDSSPIDFSRSNQNTYLKNGVGCWEYPDHVLTSWNTEPDGSGERHALGAMICMPHDDVVLYAQYKVVSDVNNFKFADYIGHDGYKGYEIISYIGNDDGEVVLPLEYNGKKVLSVGNGAFAESSVSSIVTNANIENVGEGAFSNMPNLSEILLFDSLRWMDENALLGSNSLRKVRINSATNRIYDRVLETNIVDKQMRVKTSTGKKIVTLSGCSLARGMRSELILEDEVLKDYDIIHMGVHARYGLGFLTAMVENYLYEGDIVVLALENYHHMWMTDKGLKLTNSEAWDRIKHLESNYDIFEEFDFIEQKYNNILPVLPYYFYLRSYNSDRNNVFNPTPNRYDMNEYGDYTFYRPNSETDWSSINMDTIFPNLEFLDNIDRINEWVQKQMDKGVRVYFIFPPIWDYTLEAGVHEAFVNTLKERANFEVLGSVEDVVFPYYYFCDWYNHMSTEGSYAYTAKFFELLSAAVASDGG